MQDISWWRDISKWSYGMTSLVMGCCLVRWWWQCDSVILLYIYALDAVIGDISAMRSNDSRDLSDHRGTLTVAMVTLNCAGAKFQWWGMVLSAECVLGVVLFTYFLTVGCSSKRWTVDAKLTPNQTQAVCSSDVCQLWKVLKFSCIPTRSLIHTCLDYVLNWLVPVTAGLVMGCFRNNLS